MLNTDLTRYCVNSVLYRVPTSGVEYPGCFGFEEHAESGSSSRLQHVFAHMQQRINTFH